MRVTVFGAGRVSRFWDMGTWWIGMHWPGSWGGVSISLEGSRKRRGSILVSVYVILRIAFLATHFTPLSVLTKLNLVDRYFVGLGIF